MNRDITKRKLSDSDFWNICHEMHPILDSTTAALPQQTNYTFPAAQTLSDDKQFGSSASMHTNGDDGVEDAWSQFGHFDEKQIRTDSEGSVTSDDSLQNLYVKKVRTNEKFLSAHSNAMNTQKILDTIELICTDQSAEKMDETNDSVDADGKISKSNVVERGANSFDSSESDSINNADDLLLKIAASVQQLKVNVNQIDGLDVGDKKSNVVATVDQTNKHRTGSIEIDDERQFNHEGDLIDFSDDWNSGGESQHSSNSSCDDEPIKKAMQSSNDNGM